MSGPTVSRSATGGINGSGTFMIGPLNVPTGDSVYVLIFEKSNGTEISGVTDGTNNYTSKASFAGTGGTVSAWVADNVAGSASLTVTVTVTGSRLIFGIMADITGAANPSFDKNGTGATGAYVSGTTESDSLSPSNANDLLLFLMEVQFVGSTGNPTATYSAESGEAIANSGQENNTGTHASVAGGLYTEPASGTGSTTMDGAATLAGGGTISSIDFTCLMIAILPAAVASATGPLYLTA